MKAPIVGVATAALLALGSAPASGQASAQGNMSFFLTSAGPGKGADLGGLEGADRHCQGLAASVDAGSRTWHAYLSATASGGRPAVNARDRIGTGPWFNARGVKIADNVQQLHSDAANLTKQTVLTEKGDTVQGRGDTPNRHDVLTGSNPDGTLSTNAGDTTCSNWTSSASTGSAILGHFDRTGGGQNPTSWNSAHASRGCGQENLRSTGGDGLFYCFAIN